MFKRNWQVETIVEQKTELAQKLEDELRAKTLLLADLEVRIADYHWERVALLKEIMILRERLLDLAEKDPPGEG